MSYDTKHVDKGSWTKVFFDFFNNLFCINVFLNVYSMVIYEGGSVMSQARSLWRLELARTKWSGGFINWYHPMRIRHLTTGRCKFYFYLNKKLKN